jgi:hypothetical protein
MYRLQSVLWLLLLVAVACLLLAGVTARVHAATPSSSTLSVSGPLAWDETIVSSPAATVATGLSDSTRGGGTFTMVACQH